MNQLRRLPVQVWFLAYLHLTPGGISTLSILKTVPPISSRLRIPIDLTPPWRSS